MGESNVDEKDEKVGESTQAATAVSSQSAEAAEDVEELEPELDLVELQRVFKKATWVSGILALIITIVSRS